ncbi:MAG TPA: type II secretion system protein [Patescibacteria group bacterium]|nr:type II secretion system protein [Patescibacteria group bacterium]
MYRNKRGFTLIELMVAISIVAILAVIGYTLLTTAQANARDSRRKQDIDAIATALELQFDGPKGTYPAVAVSMFADGKQPVDPVTNLAYTVTPGTAGAVSYVVCADLEGTTGNFTDAGTTPSPTNAGGFYCRKSQQK